MLIKNPRIVRTPPLPCDGVEGGGTSGSPGRSFRECSDVMEISISCFGGNGYVGIYIDLKCVGVSIYM